MGTEITVVIDDTVRHYRAIVISVNWANRPRGFRNWLKIIYGSDVFFGPVPSLKVMLLLILIALFK
jgi:hypothetical protein